MSTITGRVTAGAKFLDEHDPDWWRADVERAIDLRELDLSGGEVCILGQRCPLEMREARPVGETSYSLYATALSGVPKGEVGALDRWASALGFQMTPGWVDDPDWEDDEYEALTNEWRKVITERRAAA